MAAKSSTLGRLHEMFAAYWLSMMEREDEDGKAIPLSAAEAAVLRAFLKDNNVTADPDSTKDLDELAGELAAATKGVVSNDELSGILHEFNQFTQAH